MTLKVSNNKSNQIQIDYYNKQPNISDHKYMILVNVFRKFQLLGSKLLTDRIKTTLLNRRYYS